MNLKKILPNGLLPEAYLSPCEDDIGPWLAKFVYYDDENQAILTNKDALGAGESPNEAVLNLLKLNAGETITCIGFGTKSFVIPIGVKDFTF